MIKKLIEIVVLLMLVAVLVWMLSDVNVKGAVALKYLCFGLLDLAKLGIISMTIIVLITIILGTSMVKGIFGSDSGFWKRNRGDGKHGVKDLRNLSSRKVDISMEKYDWDFFKIKTLDGNLEVSGRDGRGANAVIEILEKEEGDVEVSFDNGEIKLKSKSGSKASIGNARLSLPGKLSFITLESVSGDISVKDFVTAAPSFLKGVSGNLLVRGIKSSGEVSVKTVNGDVDIAESHFGTLISHSISGDITVRETAAENAILESVSGDIDYSGSDIKNPQVKTISGSVKK